MAVLDRTRLIPLLNYIYFMRDFYKEFIIYTNKNLPIKQLIKEIKHLPFIIKRNDLLSIFVKNIDEEKILKTLLAGYNYKEFSLKKDETPSQNFKSLELGEIAFKRSGKANKKHIVIAPGISFGYDHPATILTVKKLLSLKNLYREKRILDVGIGSGILSLVMVKQGAKKVIGLDICPFIVKEAIKNVRKNNIKFKRIEVLFRDISLLKKKFFFIVANVPLNVHEIISGSIKRLLEKDGFFLLGGIMNNNIETIKKIYNEFNDIDIDFLEDWAIVLLKPKK